MSTKRYVITVTYQGTNVNYQIHRSIVVGFENAMMLYLNLYRKWSVVKGTKGSIAEYATENPPIEDWYTGSAIVNAYKSKQ